MNISLIKVIVPITNQAQKKFTDLKNIEVEMQRTRHFCDFINSISEDNLANVDMLMSAAVLKYMRAFSGGLREKLNPENVFTKADDLEIHNYLFKYRNFHLAHPVNGYEEPLLIAELNIDENGMRKFSSFYAKSRVVALNKKQLEPLIHLIRCVLLYLFDKISDLHQTIHAQLSKLSQVDLDSLREVTPYKFEPDKIGKRRPGLDKILTSGSS